MGRLDELSFEGYRADIFSYGSALAVCGTWRGGIQLLRALQQQGLEANQVAMASLVAANERAHHWALALQLAQRSNLVACGAACGACENVGRWLEAIQLLRYTAGAHERRSKEMI